MSKGGAAWVLNVQPEHCYFVLGGDTLAGGFDRRFFWVNLPSRDEEERPQNFNLLTLQTPILGLYCDILNWAGGRFNCYYESAYGDWYAKMARYYNQIRNDDKDLAAYLKTLYTKKIHGLTLLLHCCECAQSGRDLERISPETFQKSALLIETFIDSRNTTWKMMKNAVVPSKREDRKDDVPKALVELSEQARKTYAAICSITEATGRGATITEINGKIRAYRQRMGRMAIDSELFNAGLMYIDPHTVKDGDGIATGDRVPVPLYALDSFSGELVKTQTANR